MTVINSETLHMTTICSAAPVPRRRTRSSAGFTLIEVMVAVAIVGILATYAIPAYMENVKRSKRASAATVLAEGAQFMQRWYAARNTFTGSATAFSSTPYIKAPKDAPTDKQNYDIAAEVLNSGGGFKLTATPKSLVYTDAACGNLTLTDTGQKGATATGADVAYCWR